jgi:hypothetical protein
VKARSINGRHERTQRRNTRKAKRIKADQDHEAARIEARFESELIFDRFDFKRARELQMTDSARSL